MIYFILFLVIGYSGYGYYPASSPNGDSRYYQDYQSGAGSGGNSRATDSPSRPKQLVLRHEPEDRKTYITGKPQ